MNQERVVIENVQPQINAGRHPIKRISQETVHVSANVLVDGHDIVQASVMYKHEKARKWQENRLLDQGNDLWSGSFQVEKLGSYEYKLVGWVDYALNWQHGISRKLADGQHVKSELLDGVIHLEHAFAKANKTESSYLKKTIELFQNDADYDAAVQIATSSELHDIFYKYPARLFLASSDSYTCTVDRKKARFSTWYEFFPRSAGSNYEHGTFKDCEKLLPYVQEMGFDTLYFPPVHPVGDVNRKGKNNTTTAHGDDVGSCWGIGSKHGGHMALHPHLGSEEDFKELIQQAKSLGIEVSMDYALQAAPDHPWVKKHKAWFRWRPDGTVQYAENPPKKYQDILPIYFETPDWKNLWKELLKIALYWVEEFDIKVFRVDNPHTKPFHFWEYLISEVKKKHNDVIFLAEAFTKPKVMQQLAKVGFQQSYTYFTWRNNKHELTEYLTELTQNQEREYMQPNFWPNTPDINPWALQSGNESVHLQRYALAATLSSSIGIYGPVFEQMISSALPGKEEYLDSEKFQIANYDWSLRNKLTLLITKINQARHDLPALQQTNNLQFLHNDNDQLLTYYKWSDNHQSEVIVAVNLDPHYEQESWVAMPLERMQIDEHHTYTVKDVITGSSYNWKGTHNFVKLNPVLPFHIFEVQR
ncbi:alpha-1,4-glucan--maltose-1-phosphate maltosyltransferase [Nonlabens ponticola]|uniref:Alpha-1,4-glucan:maltose-1-phosphate maltosyltransferase n=1 Tax=Nonlabens ponticola TaxID=2496866 RepID=A0A3S9MWY9_9FLAO|nr:alpha-1,4-glucan--maltose-1-phosphate maltosyltransferase [Nonlabens ponticola]AZQ43741.1 alpha-1,4-glucan--maltose-1-phosphate maltosyltransferase [Nonlabens ponticola]